MRRWYPVGHFLFRIFIVKKKTGKKYKKIIVFHYVDISKKHQWHFKRTLLEQTIQNLPVYNQKIN
jgi:hypothetical protein